MNTDKVFRNSLKYTLTNDNIQKIKHRCLYKSAQSYTNINDRLVRKSKTNMSNNKKPKQVTDYIVEKDVYVYNDICGLTQQSDFLLWITIIQNNGLDAIWFNKHKVKMECDSKMDWVEKLKNDKTRMKHLMKKYRIKWLDTIQDIGSSSKISISSFVAIELYLKKSFVITKDKCYFLYRPDEVDDDQQETDEDIKHSEQNIKYIHIEFDSNNEILFHTTTYDLRYFTEKYIPGKTLDKPINSVSSYKLEELQSYAKIMDIMVEQENGKSLKKQELYNLIIQQIQS